MNSVDRSAYLSLSLSAVAVLALASLMAMSVGAQEAEEGVAEEGAPEARTMMVREQAENTMQERRDLFEMQRENREQFQEGARIQLEEAREQGNASETARILAEERKEMLRTQQAERLQHIEQKQQAIQERRAEMVQEMEQRKAEMQERMQERQARLAEEAQARLSMRVSAVEERLLAAIARLETIAYKVSTRADKAAEMGADVEEVKVALASVNTMITDARGSVTDLMDTAQMELASVDPRAGAQMMRDAALLARDTVRAIHEALVSAVRELGASMEALSETEEMDDDEDGDVEDEDENEDEEAEEEESEDDGTDE